MEDRYSIKRITAYICMILFAIFCIVMLVFSTVNTTGDLAKYSDVSPDSGFKWMTFQSDFISISIWETASIPFGILTLLQLIFGICAIIWVVYNFIIGTDKRNKVIILLGLISMALYTIEGIVATGIIKDETPYLNKYIGTAAFVPLIIGSVLSIIVLIFMPNTNKHFETNYEVASRNNKTTGAVKEAERVDLLMKYKDLLEKQVITKEEFEAKKKELLNI